MKKVVSSFTRHFSAIEGLQISYTLVYSLYTEGSTGCKLTLHRTGRETRTETVHLSAAPEAGCRLLQFLCENAVQPEIFHDVIAELLPLTEHGGKGGVMCEV
ncbi:MAG: hypothetical protein ACI4JC_05615 [Faecalibacterium sp.]